MTHRFALKVATDDIHQELDERLSRLDLARDRDYRRFLAVHARTVPPIEAALSTAGLDGLVGGWQAGRRSAAIRHDLDALGEAMPDPADVPPIRGTAEMLGIAYVLEGSRLGGRMLRKRVGNGLPASFLSEADHNPWPAVVEALDRHLKSEEMVVEAGVAARRCFGHFLDAAREAGL